MPSNNNSNLFSNQNLSANYGIYVKNYQPPCNVNAQLWYFTNAMQQVKNTKNPYIKRQQMAILKYYLNGNAYSINN